MEIVYVPVNYNSRVHVQMSLRELHFADIMRVWRCYAVPEWFMEDGAACERNVRELMRFNLFHSLGCCFISTFLVLFSETTFFRVQQFPLLSVLVRNAFHRDAQANGRVTTPLTFLPCKQPLVYRCILSSLRSFIMMKHEHRRMSFHSLKVVRATICNELIK